MKQSHASDLAYMKEVGIPPRDYIILPILSLLTLLFLIIAMEVITRHYFAIGKTDACVISEIDEKAGYVHRPNCTSRRKAVDGPWVTSQFNECGYRTKESCGPKPSGTARIALLGSSTVLGDYVGDDQTFAANAAHDLTRILGRPVEVQNLGREACFGNCIFHRVDEALALKPDLLVITVTPLDIENLGVVHNQTESKLTPKQSFLKRAKSYIKDSSAGAVVVSLLTRHNPAFARSRILLYLEAGDPSNYLKFPFSPAWEERFEVLDGLLGETVRKSNALNVPVVLVEIPSLQQASLSRMQNLPPGVDPYSFNERLKQIAEQHGIRYIDGIDAFRSEPEANKLFYLVDGHINEEGHTLISRALVNGLMKYEQPALLDHNKTQQVVSEQER